MIYEREPYFGPLPAEFAIRTPQFALQRGARGWLARAAHLVWYWHTTSTSSPRHIEDLSVWLFEIWWSYELWTHLESLSGHASTSTFKTTI